MILPNESTLWSWINFDGSQQTAIGNTWDDAVLNLAGEVIEINFDEIPRSGFASCSAVRSGLGSLRVSQVSLVSAWWRPCCKSYRYAYSIGHQALVHGCMR